MNQNPHSTLSTPTGELLDTARKACRRIAPLWPLQHFVAVNPFLGLTERPFVEVCELLARMVPGGMQMAPVFYREKFHSGAILEADLSAALTQAPATLPAAWAGALADLTLQKLKAALLSEERVQEIEIFTVAAAIDRLSQTTWEQRVVEALGHFCAAYFDAGQSSWRQPWAGLPLYAAWKESAALDASLEFQGLENFRQTVRALPADAESAISGALSQMGLNAAGLEDFLHQQLMSIRGWAGYVQYRVRENGIKGEADDSLLDLLAIRLCHDAALLAQHESPALREFLPCGVPLENGPSTEVLIGYLWQLAHENAWQRQLFRKLQIARAAEIVTPQTAPSVQAVFCIDVRSEVLRRALESVSPQIETLGFAGFFGMPIESIPFGGRHGTAQCPVLLSPRFRIAERLKDGEPREEEASLRRQRLGRRLTYSWNSFKTSAISCFSFVETAGLAFGAQLFQDTFLPSAPVSGSRPDCTPDLMPQNVAGQSSGIGFHDRVTLALGALKHMGLTKNFARLVLLCGHGSQTANNPYASGLDCGACGGNAGDSNARVAAAILNDPAVRLALGSQGISIPGDTWFLAGLHNTTTDEVTLFDLEALPFSHRPDVAALRDALATAGKTTRRERAASLGLDPAHRDLDGQVFARSRDWAQVRPEWGLAGNGAFLAAPRSRSRAAQLNGRVFLHGYDHRSDAGDATLELILVAPMVVANWINLQYYASTVNNAYFGSSNKITHNVVGTLGVCQGNGGDLQTGLPLQSVHDGAQWRHEPLRLHVLIEAPRERIAAILQKQEGVCQLVENGWLLLFAIEATGIYRCVPGVEWTRVADA